MYNFIWFPFDVHEYSGFPHLYRFPDFRLIELFPNNCLVFLLRIIAITLS
ncbi:hypothetical protein Sjap_024145 [Stephania japonica]|uniref:Uncharacterized protein n=1 Tax=Stephania japonica TaxID=461633 RepID=A0AAP0EK66_9MAGN